MLAKVSGRPKETSSVFFDTNLLFSKFFQRKYLPLIFSRNKSFGEWREQSYVCSALWDLSKPIFETKFEIMFAKFLIFRFLLRKTIFQVLEVSSWGILGTVRLIKVFSIHVEGTVYRHCANFLLFFWLALRTWRVSSEIFGIPGLFPERENFWHFIFKKMEFLMSRAREKVFFESYGYPWRYFWCCKYNKFPQYCLSAHSKKPRAGGDLGRSRLVLLDRCMLLWAWVFREFSEWICLKKGVNCTKRYRNFHFRQFILLFHFGYFVGTTINIVQTFSYCAIVSKNII